MYCFLYLCFAILAHFTSLPTKEIGPSILWEMSYGLSSLSQLALPLSMFGNVIRVHVLVGLPGMEAPLLSIMTAILYVHMKKFLYCWFWQETQVPTQRPFFPPTGPALVLS
jgi:hypothetical protein